MPLLRDLQGTGSLRVPELRGVLPGESEEGMTYSVTEIREQTLKHFNELKARLDQLIMDGRFPVEWEIMALLMNGGHRNSCWIKDQLQFCQGELERWSKIRV